MQTTFTFDSPFHIAIVLALLVLAVVQVILLVRSRSLAPGRKAIRAGLNGLLWVLAMAFALQPTWSRTLSSRQALLIGDDVPGAVAQRIKDSLHIRDSFTARTFKARYDSVTMLGQDFPTETLTDLSDVAVHWIPYNAPDRVYDLVWKAVVRQGENQRISGKIQVSESKKLAVHYGSQLLDSLTVKPGDNAFALQFPAFAQGRTQTEMVLNGDVLDTIRFYGRPLKPLRVQFLLNSPDFESKTLADWLGRHGHTVQLTTTLSKDVSSDVRINSGSAISSPNLLITEPANAGAAAVRKALTNGQAVLFINLMEPEAETKAISRATGSRWAVRRVSTEPAIPFGNNLTALPFRFVERMNQFPVARYPIATQRTASAGKQTAVGRVAVSMLNETFPLALSGDSLTYSRIWTAVLAQLYSTDDNNLLANAPIVNHLRQTIQLNKPSKPVSTVLVGTDTVRLMRSPFNERSFDGMYLPTQTGWQTIGDSTAIYVSSRSANARDVMRRFMLAHSQQATTAPQAAMIGHEPLPGWLWFTLFMLVLTALWLEPKLI